MLELKGLAKRYGEVVALDGLSLTARPGRLLGFLGPNGAGKTTAMRAVFGLVRLAEGSVAWHGQPVGSRERMSFGYMPEQRGLYPRMAAGAQLTYLARLRGVARDEAARAAQRWLDDLGLADRAGDAVSQLSHGNQQRVQLAAALVHEPALLVLDEPFSGLDPLGVEAMSEVLRTGARGGATVVFSSHQLDLVEELCDDVVIIAAGRDRTAGTLEEVRAAGSYRRVTIRLAGGAAVDPPAGTELVDRRNGVTRLRVSADTDARTLLDRLAPQGRVERFSLEPPALSEVFRDVVGASIADLEGAAGAVEEAST
ncbi:MAG: ATP-binding cassette domain-containing protein [Egibacteraceae bacterium]